MRFVAESHGEETFTAHHSRDKSSPVDNRWFIHCSNYLIYMNPNKDSREDFDMTKKAIQVKYPELKIIFAYQHRITSAIHKENGKGITINR